MKMKNAFSKIAVIAVLILNLCFVSVFANTDSVSAASAIDETTMGIVFFSENSVDESGNLIPDSSGKITVGVNISKKNDGISFSLKTRDMSAIESLGDYEAKSNDYHITTTSTKDSTQYFSIQTYQTNASNLITSNQAYGLTRVFEIVLCNITTDSGCDYVIYNDLNRSTSGKSSYTCRVQTEYDYKYSTLSGKNGLYFDDYLNGSSFSSIWIGSNGVYYQTPTSYIGFSVDNDSYYSFEQSFNRFVSSGYVVKYYKTDWADIYYGGSAVISESGWCTIETPAVLNMLDSEDTSVFYSEYYDPRSDGAPILFGENKYAHNNNDDYRYYLTNNAKNWLNNHTGYQVYNTLDPMYNHAYSYYSRESYDFPSVTGKVYKSNSEDFTLKVSRDSTWKMNFEYFRLDSELYDINSPKITNTLFDEITSTDNKTLRITIRFSEPVHFPTDLTDKSGLSLTAYANNNGKTPLEFKYAGGEGSDTLYFDCDLSQYENLAAYKTTKISSIKFRAYDTFSSTFTSNVYDYAYNFNLKNNAVDVSSFTKGDGLTFDTSIDLREPSVSTKIVTNYSETAMSHTVNVTVSDMENKGSKLYYTWVNADDVQDPETYVPESYDNCETITPTSLTITGEKFNGNYYLYYKAKSAYGKETLGYVNKVLSFDNTPPTISSITLGEVNAAVSSRDFVISIEGETTDLSEIYIYYRLLGQTSWTQKEVYKLSGSTSPIGTLSSFTYDSNTNLSTATLNVSAVDGLSMNDNESKRFYFKFTTYDTAGNQYTYEINESYLFDTSDRCSLNMTISGTPYTVYETIDTSSSTTVNDTESSYINSYLASNFTLTFKLLSSTSAITLDSMYKGDEDITSTFSDYFTCEDTTEGADADLRHVYTMKYKGTSGGYYSFRLSGDSKLSETFSFYIVGDGDNVAGYSEIENNKLLINKIWVVSDVKYYWLSENNTVATSENYNDSKNLSLVFSSKDRAYDYYYFMEMQDISLCSVTSTIANALNGGYSEVFKKAQNETMVAEVGQTWICYKSASWDQQSDSKNWNYYFYSTSTETEINTRAFSSNLRSAIDSVVNKIVNKGSYSYLTSDDGLNSVGVPTIDESRIHATALSIDVNKRGTAFKSPVTYVGDSDIYSPYYVDESSNEYPIAVQKLTASDYTIIYFKKHTGSTYEKVSVTGTYYLKDVINGTGLYDIIERDVNGARKYTVYIDNSSPELNIYYDNNSGTTSMVINEEYASRGATLNVKSFAFSSLNDADEYAYVALFTSGGVYKGAYLASELGGVVLDEGRYSLQVYDRSGNNYSFVLRISSADLQSSCSYINEKNKYVQFSCTYSRDDVYRFEIYLDNVLVLDNMDSLKSNKVTFYDGGEYRFYVEDLFGNIYEQTTTLIREIPQVTWYFDLNGNITKFDETSTSQLGFIKTKLGTNSYLITSTGSVSFRYPTGENYKYEFLSGSGTLRHTGTYNEVSINEKDNWQVKIYYEDYSDVFVTFTGKSDVSAPTISATTNRTKYSYNDEDEDKFNEYFESIKATAKVGDIINLTDVSFTQTDIVTQTIAAGEIVSGSIVRISVSDLSGIYKWSYSYNGTVTEVAEDVSIISLSKEGSYVISATDKLGNVSSFNFSIGKSKYTEILVDDVAVSSDYGNKNVIASVEGSGVFAFIVEGEYYKLTTNGENLIRTIYKIASDDSSNLITSAEDVVISDKLTSTGVVIKEYESGVVKAYLEDGRVYIAVSLNEEEEGKVNKLTINMRVSSNSAVDCMYTSTEISDEKSYLTYTLNGETHELSDTLYINKDCTFTLTDDIKSAAVYYSETDDYDNIYENLIALLLRNFDGYEESYTCSNQGFYVIEAFNKYGNCSSIKVLYSVNILVVGSVEYLDGEKASYSTDYENDLYSNNSITINVYKDITFTVTRNGLAYSPNVEYTDEKVSISVIGDGDYTITIKDKYGNEITRYAHIKQTDFEYDSNWLDGFNSKALRVSEGYTNTKVSFNKDKVLESAMFVSITLNDATTIVLDKLSEKQVSFKDICVGDDGDGVYEIVFRDIYGNKATKVVNYTSTSPLTISRLTRSMAREYYSMDGLTTVYSNKTINFACTASKYEFKVNSEKKDIPYTLEFPSEANSGKFEYKIEYIDEYGFEYNITCVLYRTTIEFSTSEMTVVDGVTKDPVSVTFDSNCTAQISLNGESLGVYTSGEKYSRDGSYIISISDIAGNNVNYSIKRDSVADFCLYVGSTDNKLVSGEITNNSTVYFTSLNGDVVEISSVYHNGSEVANYDSTIFTGSGKWEIVVKDSIGNQDYFCFYIVSHELIEFEYTTPYGFRITEITYDAGGGKVDWLEAVENLENNDYMKFEESGEYSVVMLSSITGQSSNFTITIDKTVPNIVLDGVNAGETTKSNVTVSGYKSGDTIYIYKDGALINTITAVTVSDVPTITEKGNYRIVVVNEAGGVSEVEFTRVYTANVATSVLIIVCIVAVSIGLFLGLLFRKRSRIE